MICQHYWPHMSSDAACRDVRLASALRRSGLGVEVLTPRYGADWPERLVHREVVVHRPLPAPRGRWSVRRYSKRLQGLLEAMAGRFETFFCSGLDEGLEALVRCQTPPGLTKVVLNGGTGSQFADLLSRSPRQLALMLNRLDAVIVPWASSQRALVGAGVDSERLRRIDIGVGSGEDWRSSDGGQWRQDAAGPVAGVNSNRSQPDSTQVGRTRPAITALQTALAEVNNDLALGRHSQVVMAIGRMTADAGMLVLADAMIPLIDHWDDLRLWLIGDGPDRETIHQHLHYHGVRHSCAMPGTFVERDDLLAIADVLVVPSPCDALEDTLPAAVAAAVPLVVADCPETRAFFAGLESLLGWFQPGDRSSLRASIRDALSDPKASREVAQRLRRELLPRRPYARTVDGYRQLFESLVAVR